MGGGGGAGSGLLFSQNNTLSSESVSTILSSIVNLRKLVKYSINISCVSNDLLLICCSYHVNTFL